MQIVVFNDLIFHTGCFLGILSSKSKIRYFVRICFLMCIFLLLALSVCRLGRVFFRLILLLIIRVIWIGYCYAAQQCIGFGRQQLKCAHIIMEKDWFDAFFVDSSSFFCSILIR